MHLAEEAQTISTMLWAFANSPFGMLILSSVLLPLVAFVVRKIIAMSPAWEKMFDQHRAAFFDACRQAEKAIPDGTLNVGMARLDFAFKLVLTLEPALANAKPVDVKLALSEAHDQLKVPDTALVVAPVAVSPPPDVSIKLPGGPLSLLLVVLALSGCVAAEDRTFLKTLGDAAVNNVNSYSKKSEEQRQEAYFNAMASLAVLNHNINDEPLPPMFYDFAGVTSDDVVQMGGGK